MIHFQYGSLAKPKLEVLQEGVHINATWGSTFKFCLFSHTQSRRWTPSPKIYPPPAHDTDTHKQQLSCVHNLWAAPCLCVLYGFFHDLFQDLEPAVNPTDDTVRNTFGAFP